MTAIYLDSQNIEHFNQLQENNQNTEGLNFLYSCYPWFTNLRDFSNLQDYLSHDIDKQALSKFLVNYAKAIQLSEQNNSDTLPSLEDAEKSLKLACHLTPESPEPYIELGYFKYVLEDHPEEALQYFIKAEDCVNKLKDSFFVNLGNINKQLKQSYIGQIKCYLEIEAIDKAEQKLLQAKSLFTDDENLDLLEIELEEYTEEN